MNLLSPGSCKGLAVKIGLSKRFHDGQASPGTDLAARRGAQTYDDDCGHSPSDRPVSVARLRPSIPSFLTLKNCKVAVTFRETQVRSSLWATKCTEDRLAQWTVPIHR
jgi:hypothetical protein